MSFIQTVLGRIAEAPERVVLYEVHGTQLKPFSGHALLVAVGSARVFLRTSGITVGDRVATLGPNSFRWIALDLAIVAEGAIAVPLYARQDPAQLAGMLRDCSPRMLVAADDALRSSIGRAWPEHLGLVDYDEVFATPGSAASAESPVESDGPITLIYTSGTSGEPKGVMLSAANVEHMLAVTVLELGRMAGQDRAEDRVFHYLPFCFAGSRVMLWSQLYRGNPLMLSTDLNNLQQEMATAAAHYFLNVPALLERIMRGVAQRVAGMGGLAAGFYRRAVNAHRRELTGPIGRGDRWALALARRMLFPRIKKLIGANLEFLACGSAALSEETQRWFEMIGIPVYQVYGLTETTAIVTIDDTEHVVPGRVGHVIGGCEIRLGEDGELLCRGPNVFMGYWNRPEATAQVLKDGWLHTGDQAEIDACGNVRIIGRVKDVLVPASGHNVSPAPIEERLTEASLKVEQAVVIGHGRPFLAAIVTGQAGDDELEHVRDKVNAGLPHYMQLRKVLRAPEPFTVENGLLTANQKLKRGAIEGRYRDAIEQIYR